MIIGQSMFEVSFRLKVLDFRFCFDSVFGNLSVRVLLVIMVEN